MEKQANMFAGFLLIPTNHLEREFEKIKTDLRSLPDFRSKPIPEDDVLASYAAIRIARIFDVSEDVAEIRLVHWINLKKGR